MYRILLFLLLSHQWVSGQDHRVAAVADVKPGLIRLRWAPSSMVGWEMGIRYGYNVERITVDRTPAEAVLLTPLPIRPYPLDKMEADNDKVAIVAEVIYGEKLVPGKGFGAFYETQNKYEWRMAMALLACDLSMQAARSAGLYFEDRDIRDGRRYIYRISVAQQPKNMLIDTAVVIAAPQLLSRPRELTIICGDKTADLAWKQDNYSAYIVERAQNGKNERDFHPVSGLPVVAPHFKDTLPDNDHRYSYRVKGITPFGDYGPYSEIITGMGITAVAYRPELDTMIIQDNKYVEIRWSLPGDLKDQLSKIMITRGSSSKGPFTTIGTLNRINKAVNSFTDHHPDATNYYRIKGITKQGTAIYSFPYFAQLTDTIPPTTPVGLEGTVDSTGIVRLKWRSNTEPDLLGYRVFRANHLKEEFSEVTRSILSKRPCNETLSFIDTITLHTLTSDIYYKIIAVDRNYNTSPYTIPIQLQRPDTIPPSAPLFTKSISNDSAIVLAWHNSTSKDVVRYSLFSINTRDSIRKQVGSWDSAHLQTTFHDTAVRPGNTYFYELRVWDAAGNSICETSSDIYFEPGIRPPVSIWKAEKQNNHILLRWQYDVPDVKQYRIYRAKNNDPFTLYAIQDGGTNEFPDNTLFLGNVYKYKISAVLRGGVKSAMSKVIEVIY
ncbi:hypothetical protein [Chitinophaga sp.]|uniref:hypothetical protein n=1 Tax=Chitinophaga sp. TaxID=1869181 RepID=UPI0031D818C0